MGLYPSAFTFIVLTVSRTADCSIGVYAVMSDKVGCFYALLKKPIVVVSVPTSHDNITDHRIEIRE